MAGRLTQALCFVSDADISLDILIQVDGTGIDLTGYGASLACAAVEGGGFEVHVGAGILAPSTDSAVRVRIPASQAATLAGSYTPCELRLLPPDGEVQCWLLFAMRIGVGASQIIGSSGALTSGALGSDAQTLTVNSTDGEVTVDASPGVAGKSYIEGLIATGTLPAGSTDADFVAWILQQAETVLMANKFFTVETHAVAVNATWDSSWRSAGVAANALTALGSFNAQVSADQPVTAWIEYSDDGATVLGATEPSNVALGTGAVGLSVPLCAEYFRVGVNNPTGGSVANVSVKASFNR